MQGSILDELGKRDMGNTPLNVHLNRAAVGIRQDGLFRPSVPAERPSLFNATLTKAKNSWRALQLQSIDGEAKTWEGEYHPFVYGNIPVCGL